MSTEEIVTVPPADAMGSAPVAGSGRGGVHATGNGVAKAYKRSRIWVNTSFQARYVAVTLGFSVAVLTVLGVLYFRALQEEHALIGLSQSLRAGTIGALPEVDEAFDVDFHRMVEKDDSRNVVSLVGIAAVLVILLGWAGVRMTFRAAGPVYAVSSMLRTMAVGNFHFRRKLRRGDEFRFLDDDIAALRIYLKQEAGSDVARMRRASEALARLAVLAGPEESQAAEKVAIELEAAALAKEERFELTREGRAG